MSEAYEKVKGGRLIFKGGALATREKPIDKKKKKKKNKIEANDVDLPVEDSSTTINGDPVSDIYTIDAAKKMKYDQLFPVEAKKFRYDPIAKSKSVEEALDDRVKKKADRYCK
ncbi:hypothetical protein Adt_06401 [Abeliophyllum distichum]|uniref:Uncharacterized protein n=1 Tax=Abeliophyllum distichum TaxID=126358 RepID=A0ABD1V6T6_9LAMI